MTKGLICRLWRIAHIACEFDMILFLQNCISATTTTTSASSGPNKNFMASQESCNPQFESFAVGEFLWTPFGKLTRKLVSAALSRQK